MGKLAFDHVRKGLCRGSKAESMVAIGKSPWDENFNFDIRLLVCDYHI
jgi:hypothetical protein